MKTYNCVYTYECAGIFPRRTIRFTVEAPDEDRAWDLGKAKGFELADNDYICFCDLEVELRFNYQTIMALGL